MKNILISITVVSIILLSSCEYRRFDFVVPFSDSAMYAVNQTGNFNETETIDPDDIMDDLDIPEDGAVEYFYIESITLSAETNSGNQASGINISGTLTDEEGTINLFSSNQLEFELGEINEININSLNSTAVHRIERTFQRSYYFRFWFWEYQELNLSDPQPFDISISGTTIPGNTAIVMDVSLKFNGSCDAYYCFKSVNIMLDPCFEEPLEQLLSSGY